MKLLRTLVFVSAVTLELRLLEAPPTPSHTLCYLNWVSLWKFSLFAKDGRSMHQ